MLKNLIKKGKGNKGFTLIELIVVIAIIAILALILVPRFTGFTETANNRTNESNRRTIETAVNVMLADGRLSGTGEFLVAPAVSPATGLVVTIDTSAGTLKWATGPAVAPVPATNAGIKEALEKLIGDKLTPAGSATGYNVTIAAGNVSVADNP